MKAIRAREWGRAPAPSEKEPAVEAEERPESLRETALRLHPRVAWERMSETAIRRSLGLLPQDCVQRQEYEAGRLARGEGAAIPEDASMAFRLGWQHGRPPRARRRRWRPRPASKAPGSKEAP